MQLFDLFGIILFYGFRQLQNLWIERIYFLFSYFKDLLRQTRIGTALLHHDCRRKFVNTRKVTAQIKPRKKLRSSVDSSLDWKSCCFLCNHKSEHKYSTVFQVRTIPLLKTLMTQCINRNDEWEKKYMVVWRLVLIWLLRKPFTTSHAWPNSD